MLRAMRDFGCGQPRDPACLIAEVARVWPALRSIVSTSNLAASVLTDGGSPELKEKYLPRILSGEAIASFALSEPNIGSDAANIETRADETATGWRVNGRKLYISLGPVCELGVVFVRTRRRDGAQGVSLPAVRARHGRLFVQPDPQDGHAELSIGRTCSRTWTSPPRTWLAPKARASPWPRNTSISAAAWWFSALGIAQAAYDAAVKYAGERVQFDGPSAASSWCSR